MEALILGGGCSKCEKLAQLVEKAVEELGIDCQVKKVTDLNEIASYGVMLTPALVVDGKVKCYGKVPSLDEIKKFLNS